MKAASRGFSLLELLVALAVVALGLGAASRAALQASASVEHLRVRTLAGWVAEDRLVERRRSWPEAGAYAGTQVQAGIAFAWRERVRPTSDAALRRIDVEVAATARPDHVLAWLSGVAVQPALER